MDKVYLVTRGDYSDYRVSAVFDDKKKADSFIKCFDSHEYRIEIYNLNPFEEEIRKCYKPYFVRMDIKGDCKEIYIEDSDYGFDSGISHGFDIDNNMFINCFAKDEKHAIKIANEKRIQLIALNKYKNK